MDGMVDADVPDEAEMAKVEDLRRRLRADPDSENVRHDLLLAFCHPYFHGDAERIALIVWHISHRPNAPLMSSPCAEVDHERFPELHAEVARAWEVALTSEPLPPAVALGAARFLFATDPERARQLLRDALTAHPGDARLWIDLGGAFDDPAERLRCFQEARRLEPAHRNLLSWLCEAALAVGDLPLAAQYGAELLAESEAGPMEPAKAPSRVRDGRAFLSHTLKPRGQRAYAKHHAHTTLGLVALRNGDKDAALEHLRASVDVDTDPRLSSYGPSFALAHELCVLGLREDVRRYLEACGAFWNDPILEEWLTELREGRIPTFE